MKGSCLSGSVEHEIILLDSPIRHSSLGARGKADAAAFGTTASVKPGRLICRKEWGAPKSYEHEPPPDKRRYLPINGISHPVGAGARWPHPIRRVTALDADSGKHSLFRSGGCMKHHSPDAGLGFRLLRNDSPGAEHV